MTRAHDEIASRRSLLSARAALDRARVTLALHDVKSMVVPPSSPAHAGFVRPLAAMLVGLIAPAMGMSRFNRWLRVASFGLAAWRVARNWRAR
jgi:hypothetical protein